MAHKFYTSETHTLTFETDPGQEDSQVNLLEQLCIWLTVEAVLDDGHVVSVLATEFHTDFEYGDGQTRLEVTISEPPYAERKAKVQEMAKTFYTGRMTPENLTGPQNDTMIAKFDQNPDGCETIVDLYNRLYPLVGSGEGPVTVMMEWAGMSLGIEPDGYAHS